MSTECDECWESDAEYMIGTGWTEDDIPLVRMVCSACKELVKEIPDVTQVVINKLLAA